jgi:hypothetical protein
MKGPRLCPTGKVAYLDQASAWDEVKRQRREKKHRLGYAPRCIYVCPACGLWHVTSKRPRDRQPQSKDALPNGI